MKSILAYKYTLILAVILHFTANGYSQNIGLKTNTLYWATATPNIGAEISVGRKLTLDLTGGYNPWELGNNKKFKHWIAQSELRYWFCETFEGHFLGIHTHREVSSILEGLIFPDSYLDPVVKIIVIKAFL